MRGNEARLFDQGSQATDSAGAADQPGDDPGAPKSPADDASRGAANYGIDGKGDFPAGDAGLDFPEAFDVATIDFDIAAALAFLKSCETSDPRVTYGLGCKIKPGQAPGRDFKRVDCSGFVREEVRRATTLGGSFPDGSVVQHDWVRKKGFARDSVENARTSDGAVRIAFLPPSATPSGIGHVVLVYEGKTLESHGGVGPDSRPWTGAGWQAHAFVYVLSSPVA